jgi:Undecaprenyl-phosphate glucose phosphotransferase
MLEATSNPQMRPVHLRSGRSQGRQSGSSNTAADRTRRPPVAAASPHAAIIDNIAEHQSAVSAGRSGTSWLVEPVIIGLVRSADYSIVLIAGVAAHLTMFSRPVDLRSPELLLVIIGLLLAPQAFGLARLYLQVPSADGLRLKRLVSTWATAFFGILMLALITRTGDYVSYLWMGLWFLYGSIGLCAVRLLFAHHIRRWRRVGLLTRNLVIVGAWDLARCLADHLQTAADSSVRLIGLFCDPTGAPQDNAVMPCSAVGGPHDLVHFVRANRIDQVVIAVPWNAPDRLLSWTKCLSDVPADILLCPAVPDRSLAQCGVVYLNGLPLLRLSQRPLSGWSYIAKAIEDRLLASLLLMFCGPLMLLIALLVRVDSPGPVLFRQKRHGFNNAVIDVLKFRTMRAEAAEFGAVSVQQATRNDPRVTRVGRWLRRTSLDELPQLFNVLGGEMSLVGPRPHAVAHNEHYAKFIDGYLARHRVKPGITGWAQINGFRGETSALEEMAGRIQCDLYYIEHWSLLLDLQILVRTLLVGFVHRNAY